MMFKRIDHLEIIARDLDEAIAFYTEIFGFRVKQRLAVESPPLEEIAYLALGDTVLELMRVKDPLPPPEGTWQRGYRMMALEVADMEKTLAYLAGKGVATTWGPVTLGKSKRAEITDCDGNAIELRQW